jgi:hypothetical protein
MGTEIRTFNTLKDINEYVIDQTEQHRALYEDYSQWLGTLLRDCEANHKNEDWYQKTATASKTAKAPAKKAPEKKPAAKGKKGGEDSIWVPSGNILLSSTDQGQAEILFEAIEKIGSKISELEKLKGSVQQLERIGLGKNVNYILYIEDDVPKKIVVQPKAANTDNSFKYATEMSIQAYYNDAVAVK